MNGTRLPARADRRRAPRRATIALAVAVVSIAVGCAPDAVRNRQATGLNAYIDTLATVCKPLIIGSVGLAEMIQYNSMMNQNYEMFFDNTSRLYYNEISPAGYREALTAFLGPGSYNDASFSCIFANLPAQRPNRPGN